MTHFLKTINIWLNLVFEFCQDNQQLQVLVIHSNQTNHSSQHHTNRYTALDHGHLFLAVTHTQTLLVHLGFLGGWPKCGLCSPVQCSSVNFFAFQVKLKTHLTCKPAIVWLLVYLIYQMSTWLLNQLLQWNITFLYYNVTSKDH